VRVAEELESLIRTGQWSAGKLPGLRGIAADRCVSVVTASRALQVLRDKGLISSVERAGSFLLEPGRREHETWGLCLRLTPGAWLRATSGQFTAAFDALAGEEAFDVRTDLFDFDAPTHRPPLKQARAAAEAGIRGVFLVPSRLSDETQRCDEAIVEACRSAGLPVVLIERNLRGPSRQLCHDLVGTDDLRAGQALTAHLLGLGRQRVACVVASPTSTHELRLAGYLLALQDAEGGPRPALVHRSASDGCDKAATAELADRLLADRADAAVCYSDYAAMGLVLELLSRGVRVPHDLAVAGFDDLPIGNAFTVGITTYAVPTLDIARRAVGVMHERIHRPDAPPVHVQVPGKLVIRQSCGG
jgi:LacI family transcriptional regulator